MHNLILLYDPDVFFRQQTFLIDRKNQPDIYRDQTTVPTGPTYNNDAYGGGTISGYDFNLAMAGSLRTPAFRPQHNGDYSMVSVFRYPMFKGNHRLILPS